MLKFLITLFLFLSIAAPALAKSKDVYPVSCGDLWVAVKDSLENPHNYGILYMNDIAHRTSFIVVGNLTAYTDQITLMPRDGGCALKAAFLQVGSDNGDWRQFHHRLERSLARLAAPKAKAERASGGQ